MGEIGEMFHQNIPDKFVLELQVFAVINKGTSKRRNFFIKLKFIA